MNELYNKFRSLKDKIMHILVYLALIIALIPLFSILFEVFIRGISAINLDFFIKPTPAVGEIGGIANAIQGTLITIGLASVIGVPIGIITGIFLSEYSENKLSTIIRLFNELLNGMPSIVIGLFAYVLIATVVGFSVIAASFALALIMIPIVSITTEEALKLVPASIREAAIALGMSRWKTVIFVALRTTKKTIITGILQAIARIAGESAPILVTMGYWKWWFAGLDRPVANLALDIFLFAKSPFENWIVLAWGSALILIIIILSINIVARIIMKERY
ncbi:MAG: phosphate ABC transporter permease PtsA [Candidatus Methanomethylicota archaeon]|jgi:phosphate transport system permease protein|uniref:Phosphate transport system permease protein PstA n=1 Tax=Thermoproteota archaeon TaxID=2056631 RepID=A0A523BH93_9CREN|nr:MAG: phosphate ABC transporter permease PstA [Candidatus Verstraetearchaeota archaeon]TDA40296.1 MAG: phosphate ABC transporter permease PtsA [Candidatus Verstraetearchaeota archaeon]